LFFSRKGKNKQKRGRIGLLVQRHSLKETPFAHFILH